MAGLLPADRGRLPRGGAKLAELEITEEDVADAVTWARRPKPERK